MKQIIKRDGSIANFDKKKISKAIKKSMKYGSGIYNPTIADKIADDIAIFVNLCPNQSITVSKIEELI